MANRNNRQPVLGWILVIALAFLVFCSIGLFMPKQATAQELTNGQRTTLKNAIAAEPSLAAAYAARDDQVIADWCNAASSTDAWLAAADARTMFEATNITKYDGLTAGKRAAWDRMERFAPLDFGRNALRNAVVDVWGSADAVGVLQALREKATNCQARIGGTTRTTNTVTALDRSWAGTLSRDQVSDLLNNALRVGN